MQPIIAITILKSGTSVRLNTHPFSVAWLATGPLCWDSRTHKQAKHLEVKSKHRSTFTACQLVNLRFLLVALVAQLSSTFLLVNHFQRGNSCWVICFVWKHHDWKPFLRVHVQTGIKNLTTGVYHSRFRHRKCIHVLDTQFSRLKHPTRG